MTAIELTPTETKVLRLIAAGLTDAQIGSELGMSMHTARTHAANINRKLRARSRAQAVAIAMREGLIW